VTDIAGLLRRIDGLYESVVAEPAAWNDVAFAEWGNETVADGPVPKEAARLLRRCLRVAQKLQRFWLDPPASAADSWTARVDSALGATAWRPTLDLARLGLEIAPSEELFEEVKARFRLVHSDRWMEGVGYDDWRMQQGL
jgi:hypothetical protein